MAQVGFTEWTSAGRLRHPRFLGLRDDKPASQGGARVMTDGTITVGRREVTISHPDKRLFADPPITKLELARHYERVAGAMLPLVRDRPLALQAFPDGIEGKGFFMKSVPKYFPDWIATATVPKRGGTLTQVLADDPATLVYLAGQNVVTPHIWLSRADEPHQPDRLIIDFDPSPGVQLRRDPRRRARRRRAAARCRAGDVRDGHRLARDPRRLPAAPRPARSPRSTASPARWPSGWSPTTRRT